MVTQMEVLSEIRAHPGITTVELAKHFLEANPRRTYPEMRMHINNKCQPLLKWELVRCEKIRCGSYLMNKWFPLEASE